MAGFNDPPGLPQPMPERPERDEDEAYERARQRELDCEQPPRRDTSNPLQK